MIGKYKSMALEDSWLGPYLLSGSYMAVSRYSFAFWKMSGSYLTLLF